ncbi:MAG: phytoene/squalene synthase family protein, partial [Mesorhizobium sp.]
LESSRHSPLSGAARLSAWRRHWLLLRRATRGWPDA